MTAAASPCRQVVELPEGFWYSVKSRVLGPPLVTEQLKDERLSRPLALGVLSCDGLSSTAYGTEEILRALLPFFGLAAFSLVLPMTLLILFGVVLVVLSYREVVSVYTRAGGSYVVARENFGPRVAQVAAVALLIDYVVTVAVQTAAGSAAIVSAFPELSGIPVIGLKILLVISVVAILAMCLGNLRRIREAGRIFAFPTYLFAGSLIVMILTGVIREMTGGLPHVVPGTGAVGIGSHSGPYTAGSPPSWPRRPARCSGPRRPGTRCSSCSRPRRPRSCSPAATPASPVSRSWPASSRRTPSCRAG
jgi:amino acid transporter